MNPPAARPIEEHISSSSKQLQHRQQLKDIYLCVHTRIHTTSLARRKREREDYIDYCSSHTKFLRDSLEASKGKSFAWREKRKKASGLRLFCQGRRQIRAGRGAKHSTQDDELNQDLIERDAKRRCYRSKCNPTPWASLEKT